MENLQALQEAVLEKERQKHLTALQALSDANHYQAIFSRFEKWSQLKSGRDVFNDPRFFAYLDTAGVATHQLALHIEFIRASFMNYHLSQVDLHATFFGNFS